MIGKGYESEADLFVVRACLDMLLKTNDLNKTKKIRQAFSRIQTPLTNLIDMTIECIEAKEFEIVRRMANEDYAP